VPSQDKDKHVSRFSRPKASQKDDPEIALNGVELQVPKAASANSSVTPVPAPAPAPARNHSNEVDHYTLAERMRNWHALDVGPQCKSPLEPQ
jgi:hypothetical protein